MKAKAIALAKWLYNHLGDPRTKNIMLLILAAMTAFGMIAPDTATSIRDAVLSLAM